MQNNQWQLADPDLARRGQLLISWAEKRMPALAMYKRELAQLKPLLGVTISGSLHLTSETAALARCLQTGGARIALSGSNPLSNVIALAEELLAPDGGFLFDGYRLEAPLQWKKPFA